jgi:acetyl-CoA/propionyl-CoA carboxylase biotin carboxyl carrier protein
VIPFHRAVLEEPSFVAETDDAFAVHTTWIETEFATEIDPWDGAIEDGFDQDELYRTVVVEVEGRRLRVGVPAGIFTAGERARMGKAPKRDPRVTSTHATGHTTIIAPMQSTVVKVAVSEGQSVVTGDLICVLEAMKMEQPVLAEVSGTITGLSVSPGDVIQSRQVIAVLEPAS